MKLILYFSLFQIIFVYQVIAGPKDELNLELRKEMGLENSSKETKSTENQSQTQEPKNLIQERYAVQEEESGGLFWILFKIFSVFAILSAIMYYVLKILSKNRNSRFPVKGMMRVLSSLPIAGGKEVMIIDVGGILLTIGVSENSITVLKEIDSPEVKERILHARDTSEPPEESFVEVLLKNFKGTETLKSIVNGIPKETQISEEEVMEEIKNRQIDKLDKIRKERQDILKKEVDRGSFSNYA